MSLNDDNSNIQESLIANNEIQSSTNVINTTGSRIPTTVKGLRRAFIWFAIVASTNHALNYVVNAFSSSLLEEQLAGVSLGMNWSVNSVAGLFIATPIVRLYGFKYAMIIAFWGYTIQIFTLFISGVQPSIAWPVCVFGSLVAGVTSAIWWTAQGVCFEATCNLISKCPEYEVNSKSQNGAINEIRSNISATWTLIYQGTDILVFLPLSILPQYLPISVNTVVGLLTLLGATTAIAGFTINSFGQKGDKFDLSSVKQSIYAVPKQFSEDARTGLFAPFVFGFGITTAMFALFINEVISDSKGLGIVQIGLLESLSYFIAAVSAFPYAYISRNISGGQHYVIQFGSFCFMLTGVILLIIDNDQLGTWPYIILMKSLYGLGRGVFEGSCRAVYAELFTGDDLGTAFAGQTLLGGFSGGICYFIYGSISRSAVASITFVNGFLAIVCYTIMLSSDYHHILPWSDVLKILTFQYKKGSSSLSDGLSGPLLSADP